MTERNLYDLSFDDLPSPMRVWMGSPGSHEETIDKLSILTPDVVAKAASDEIKIGHRVTASWSLTKLEYAPFGRLALNHRIVPILDGYAFDDEYSFNPQQSSQWDGLRHFSQPKLIKNGACSTERVFYGGTTKDEINAKNNVRIGIQAWAKEGIAGRGVLIDYAWWVEKNGIKYSTFSPHAIKLADIQAIAHECGIEFRKGDILFIRIGMTKEWDTEFTDAERKAYAQQTNPVHAGVENTVDVLRWLWNTGFAAVAGDAISWELYPSCNPELFLHEWIIAGWGMPIGEMFDLEALSQTCHELQRWTFFVASAPLNMPGGVSSPPNAMMIF